MYCLGSLALASALDWDAVFQLPAADLAGIAAFIALGVAAELLGVDVPISSRRDARSSIVFIPLFACAIHYPPAAAVLVAGAVSFTSCALRRSTLLKALLNTSIAMITMGTAAVILAAISGGHPIGDPRQLLGFAVFVFAAFAGNAVLVAAALSWIKGANFPRTLRSAAGGGGANILFDFLASPFALITASLYADHGIAGLVIIVLPLIVIRSSYQTKVKLQQANKDLLAVLVKAIETRDPYTSGHSVRVSRIARLIAEDLGLPRSKCETIGQAALLHDIGKIDPDFASVIRKPYALTAAERLRIQAHATAGAALLETLGSLDDEVIRGVRHHHEFYDGTGYPDGLTGTDIPLASRIIMVSDSIDAMLSDRPYRRALTVQDVESELRRCAGTQFDPLVVEVVMARRTLDRIVLVVAEQQQQQQTTEQVEAAVLASTTG